jgi:UDP-glucose 4-epimerase
MERILVTGSTGRIGSNLVKVLVEKGYQVRSLVYPGDPKVKKLAGLDTEIVYADLRDLEAVIEAVRGADAIAHLGYLLGRLVGMDNVTPSDEFAVNMGGTFNMLEAARHYSGRIEKFLFASSVCVYSFRNRLYEPINEFHPCRPVILYGICKQMGWEMAKEYQREYGLPVTCVLYDITRTPNEYDDWFRAKSLIFELKSYGTKPGFTYYVDGESNPWKYIEEKIRDEDELVIPRNPEGKPWKIQITDIRDAVLGTVLALEKKDAVGEAFGIGSARGISFEEAVHCIADKTGRPFVDVTLPNYWSWECDYSKARAVLGYTPEHSFQDMVETGNAILRGEETGIIPNWEY